MLWYKAWLETRSRFVISLCAILALCSDSVFYNDRSCRPLCKTEFYYKALHSGDLALCLMWVLAVNLLMMGGLVREKALGTSFFSLALPVPRMRLVTVRILMGLIEAIMLILIPWIAMSLVATVVGKAYPSFQIVFHVALLTGGGLVFFALAILVSSLVEGEHTAPMVSLGIALAMYIVFPNKSLRAWIPWNLMLGVKYFHQQTGLLVGSIPWLQLMANVMAAAVLTAISIKVIQRREF